MQSREYLSKYTTDGKATEAQYLTDIACERIAKREKEVLPKRYWILDKWKKHFRRQIVAANALLKEFTCKQIVDALNSPRGKNIYSLGLNKPISEIITNKVKEKVKYLVKADEDIFTDDWNDQGNIEYHGEKLPANKKKSVWEELNG
jgi:hypothetical protein